MQAKVVCKKTGAYATFLADPRYGKGHRQLDYIIEIARAQGYRTITATFLTINGAMRRLFERKGFAIRAGEDGADGAEMGLLKFPQKG